MAELWIKALSGIPLIQPGDDLSKIIYKALEVNHIQLQDQDVLVISSKIVSKAEGRFVDLSTVTPSETALQIAQETHKDPRIVHLVLQESVAISRKAPHVLIVQHRLGFVSANAGIDQSNVGENREMVLLLPENPDASAERIRQAFDNKIGVIISDSHGRPFRLGNVGVAIGVAGLPALVDLRGQSDLFGYELRISIQGYADLIASAAHLVCGEGNEGLPVVLIRGLTYTQTNGRANDLNRPPEQDLYR